MTDAELETYARHLSLPGVGMRGQETLLAVHVHVASETAWADALRLALTRSGAHISDATGSAPELWQVASGAHVGEIQFRERDVAVGAIDAPARWLGALIAAEILWRALGHRPHAGLLRVVFPNFAFQAA